MIVHRVIIMQSLKQAKAGITDSFEEGMEESDFIAFVT